MKKIILLILPFLILPTLVFAQAPKTPAPTTPPATTSSTACTNCPCGQFYVGLAIGGSNCFASFSVYLVALFGQAINIAFGLSVLIILWGAYKYTTAAGDEARVKDGKDWIVGAVVGFSLLVLIKVLIPLIQIQ